MAQLWGGRFTKETDQLVYNFNASISFDQKFYKQDIQGSMAHVKMLAKQGILTEAGARYRFWKDWKAFCVMWKTEHLEITDRVRRYPQLCGGKSD